MAFPQVTTTNGGRTTSTATTITLPASIAAGDLILVFLLKTGATVPTVVTSGYSLSTFFLESGSAYLHRLTKVAAGGETTISITHESANIGYIAIRIADYGGTFSQGSVTTAASATSNNVAAVTPSWGADDNLIIAVSCHLGSVTVGYPYSDGTNLNVASQPTATGAIAISTTESTAGSVDPGSFTYSTGTGNTSRTIAMAFQPASAADSTPPEVVSATVNAAGTQLTIVFDEAVEGDGTGFSIDVGSSLTATYVSGDGTDTWVFSLSGVVLDADTPVLTYDSGVGNIADLAANELATIASGAVTNNSTQVADVTDPTLSSISLTAPTTLVLTFDEAVNLTNATGMTIALSGASATVSYASGDGTNTVTLTVSRSVAATESLSFSYDSGTGNVEDLSGNALATISNQLVTNNVSSSGGIASYGIKTGGQL